MILLSHVLTVWVALATADADSGAMTPLPQPEATSADTSPLDAHGLTVGVSAQAVANHEGFDDLITNNFRFSTSIGWRFGRRLFHGPELVLGIDRFHASPRDTTETPWLKPRTVVSPLASLAYGFGYDLWRAEKLSLGLSHRLLVGMVFESGFSRPTPYVQLDPLGPFVRFLAWGRRLNVVVSPSVALGNWNGFAIGLSCSLLIEF